MFLWAFDGRRSLGQELIAEMDGVLDELKKAQDAVHVELLATKDREDPVLGTNFFFCDLLLTSKSLGHHRYMIN